MGPRFIGKAPFLEVTLTVGGRFGTITKTTRGQGPPICPLVMGAIQYFSCVGHQEAVARAPATAAVWELGPFGKAVLAFEIDL